MDYVQLYPNPGLDPGFRLDPRGRARFQYKGFPVDVVVRYTDEEHDEVTITASVTLNGIEVADATAYAPWDEPSAMESALREALRHAVGAAVRNVKELSARVADIEAKEEARRASVAAEGTP